MDAKDKPQAAPAKEETPKETPAKDAPAAQQDAPQAETGKGGEKTVTAAEDLRVVTKDLVVIRLYAGKPRKLPGHLVHAAQAAAGDKQVELKIE